MAMKVPRSLPARAECVWTVAGFFLFAIASSAFIDTFFPEWYDREYQVRRKLLAERVRENPDKPVGLVIGSSRTVVSFTPETLGSICDANGRAVLFFNYSHFGAGPRMNLLEAHRVVRDGVRPTYVVLELVPGFVAHDDLPTDQMAIVDIGILWPYANQWRLVGRETILRVNNVYRTRTQFLRWAAPEFVTKSEAEKDPTLFPLGGDNKWGRLDVPTEKEKAALTGLAFGRFHARMVTFHIDPQLAAANDELVAFCQREGMQVALLMTPEDSRYRSWYRPGAEEDLQAYLADLRSRFLVPIVDARLWIADEGFSDPHHLNGAGTKEFMARFEREVLRPLVAGELGRIR
jgi:hypothetical protein